MKHPSQWINTNAPKRNTRSGTSLSTQPAHAEGTKHSKPKATLQDDYTLRLRVHARLLKRVCQHLSTISDVPTEQTFNRLLRSALRRWLRNPTPPTYHIDPSQTDLTEISVTLPKGLIQRWLAEVYSNTPTRQVHSDVLVDSLHHAICLRVGLDPSLQFKRPPSFSGLKSTTSASVPKLSRSSPTDTPVPTGPTTLPNTTHSVETPTHNTLEDALTHIFTQPTPKQGSDAPKPPPPPSTRPVKSNDSIPQVLRGTTKRTP